MTLFQSVVLGILCVFAVNLAFNLRVLSTPLHRPCHPPSPVPLVSVLIPARNEEQTIGQCVESIRSQDYPRFEVLVLDDQSSDRTAEIVAGMAAADERVRLLRGEVPPPGWAGKPHACLQLARAAAGEYLLFVDADTTHSRNMLSTVVPQAIQSGAMLVSGYPRQIVRSFAERAAVPPIYFLLLCALPLTLPVPGNRPPRSFMLGQFMLFPRDLYWSFGGHEAVRSRILEDMFLGIEARKAGGTYYTVNLTSLSCCRMYRDARSVWEGCRKWGYSFASGWPVATAVLEVAVLVLYVGPGVALIAALAMPQTGGTFLWLSVAQVAVIAVSRAMFDISFRLPLISTVLTPVGVTMLVSAFVHGSMSRFTRGGATWKGRRYDNGSGVN